MHLGVRGVAGLIDEDGPRRLADDLPGAREGVGHEDAGGENHLGAEVPEEGDALRGHGRGHRQDQAVAADRGGEREADAGVPAGRLDDRPAGGEDASPLGVLDERHPEAILHAAAGIPHLELPENPAREPGGDPPELDHGRAADRFGVSAGDHGPSPERRPISRRTTAILSLPFSRLRR